ncbi:MAG: hypothetical protein AB7G93_17930 [Bdellovibrionales bacterium]
MSSRRLGSHFVPSMAIGLACAAAYLAVWSADYVQWDDDVFILSNPILNLPFLEAVSLAFTRFFHGDYLPLTLMSYWLEVAVFGVNPTVQHVVNFALHLLNVGLIGLIVARLFGTPPLTWFVAVVFALHPLQSEPVMWVSERKGLLATTLALSAAWFSLQAEGERRPRYILFYLLSFALALLAKASVVLLPLLLLIGERGWPSLWRKHLLALTLSGVLIGVRFFAYFQSAPSLRAQMESTNYWARMPVSVLNALGFYLRSFLWPLEQSIIYPPFHLGTDLVLNLVVLLLGILGVGWCWRSTRIRGRDRGASDPASGLGTGSVSGPVPVPANALGSYDHRFIFFSLLILVPLFPALPWIPRLSYVNDRYLYLSCAGLAGLVYLCLERRLPNRALKSIWMAALLVLIYPTHSRSRVWRTNLTLWEDAAAKMPASALVHLNLGLEKLRSGDSKGAWQSFESSARFGESDGVSALAYSNLAMMASDPSQPERFHLPMAYGLFERALSFPAAPADRYTIRFNQAVLLRQMNRAGESRKALQALSQELAETSDLRLLPIYKAVNDQLASLARIGL